MSITSKERVLAAINMQEPDRVPMDFSANKATLARLLKDLGCPDLVFIIVTMCLSMIGWAQQASAKQDQPGYKSKIPQYTFADTLQEQLAQLKTNPLMLRFAESRQKMAGDRYRPIYHYVNPLGRMGDPDGFCRWQGRWHHFYQSRMPEEPKHVHWGHAVSDDLVHWKDLPPALYPGPEQSCFSGGSFVEKDRVIAMYHGTGVDGSMVAISNDPLLLNWEKLTGKPVLTQTNPGGANYRVFDPCIWKKGQYYYALTGVYRAGPGNMRYPAHDLFRSKNLINWEYLHEFVENKEYFWMLGDDGACPYFWPIGDRHILLHFSHMSGGQYILGDYDKDKDKFIATSHGYFNFGKHGQGAIHAPSATPDGKGGVIVVFNVNWAMPSRGWNGILSMPRRLTLIGKDQLGIEPAGDFESLRYDHQHIDEMAIPANKEIILENINGNAMEICAEIDPGKSQMIELNVLRSPDKSEYTRINYYPNAGYIVRSVDKKIPPRYNSNISVDVTHSTTRSDLLQSRPPETAMVPYEPGETLKLRIFIDKSIVEVFVNGKQCVTLRAYPEGKDSVGVSIYAQGNDATLKSLDAWQMKSIYE